MATIITALTDQEFRLVQLHRERVALDADYYDLPYSKISKELVDGMEDYVAEKRERRRLEDQLAPPQSAEVINSISTS